MQYAENRMERETILQAADDLRGELLTLSHNIHENPELGYEEHKAVQWQVELLRKYGFEVENPYSGMNTAYCASIRFGKGEKRAAHRFSCGVRRLGGLRTRVRT